MSTPAPNIERWLDGAGLTPSAFRLLARIARRAGRTGVCRETVPNMARGCKMGEKTAQRHLPTLVKAGFLRVVQADTPKTPKHYALGKKMHLDKEGKALLALFCPASLDDGPLSPNAFRLHYHYLASTYEGEVKANHARAARVCFGAAKSTQKVRVAERELLEAGFITVRHADGKHSTFSVRRTKAETFESHEPKHTATKPPTCDTPTVERTRPNRPFVTPLPPTCDTPNRPLVTPKGLWEGLQEGSTHDDKKDLKNKPKNVQVKTDSVIYFRELLGKDCSYFKNFLNKSGNAETVMAGWLETWGAERITEVWTYLNEHKTPWHENKSERDARLYGLLDTMQGDFIGGQPQRLCTLWCEVGQEQFAKRQAAIPKFEQYDVVRVGNDPTEYVVLNSSGPTTFFETGSAKSRGCAKSCDCVFIRHTPPEEPTERYESAFVRRRREARERRQHPKASQGAAQWTR